MDDFHGLLRIVVARCRCVVGSSFLRSAMERCSRSVVLACAIRLQLNCLQSNSRDITYEELVTMMNLNTGTVHLLLLCTMNQEIHNSFTYYYTAPTCFDTIVSSSGSL